MHKDDAGKLIIRTLTASDQLLPKDEPVTSNIIRAYSAASLMLQSAHSHTFGLIVPTKTRTEVPILGPKSWHGKTHIISLPSSPSPSSAPCSHPQAQKRFDKCYFPFMTSALAAQWQGGFCQRTCERCSCAAGAGVGCSEVSWHDPMQAWHLSQGACTHEQHAALAAAACRTSRPASFVHHAQP